MRLRVRSCHRNEILFFYKMNIKWYYISNTLNIRLLILRITSIKVKVFNETFKKYYYFFHKFAIRYQILDRSSIYSFSCESILYMRVRQYQGFSFMNIMSFMFDIRSSKYICYAKLIIKDKVYNLLLINWYWTCRIF